MNLPAGSRLGPYEIVAPIGAGGMGEVYRARDTKLGRDVAIKTITDDFVQDKERVARFEREARLLASLNHPGIATLYGLEELDGHQLLVMELVEGDTLSDRLTAGPIVVTEALRLFRQIAEALESAHEKGIVHRDLKPANIKITPENQIKILDFGLAKAFGEEAPVSELSESPTMARGTALGVILGTAPYMSPEQARGKSVDKRTDIWAFGCCLFETLTGRKAFIGDTVSDTIAAILEREPDWGSIPSSTPRDIQKLIRRCLKKSQRDRLKDIGDARSEIDEAIAESDLAGSGSMSQAAQPRRLAYRSVVALAVLAAGLLLMQTIYLLTGRSAVPAAEQPSLHLSVAPPSGTTVETVSVSPDGTLVAFVAVGEDGRKMLYVPTRGAIEPQPLDGTEGATYPFWSPDSRHLGFYADGKLKKVEVSGAPPEVLCDVPAPRGATWSSEGDIVFAVPGNSGLSRVASTGGVPEPITTLDLTRQEDSHRWPSFLPDGRHYLYFVRSSEPKNTGIYISSLDSDPPKQILNVGSMAIYAPPGYLLYVRQGTLMAHAFDVDVLALVGDPQPIGGPAWYDPSISGLANFSASDNGVLVYRSGTVEKSELVWYDRNGGRLGAVGTPATHLNLALSPGEKKLAISRAEERSSARNIWLFDLAQGTETHFTFSTASDFNPLWSPDESRIVFGSNREGSFDIYEKVVSGGAVELIFASKSYKYVRDWSPDGRYILYDSANPEKSNMDIWVLPLGDSPEPYLFQSTDADEWHGKFSPDGRYVAYVSNESGHYEVYVQPFPATGAKWQVSIGGGLQPLWSRDGTELFYVAPDQSLMAVPVRTNGGFAHDVPKALFQAHIGIGDRPDSLNHYDVGTNGQRFLVSTVVAKGPDPIVFVTHWTKLLEP